MRKVAWACCCSSPSPFRGSTPSTWASRWATLPALSAWLLLLAAIPAVLQAGRMRTPGPIQWLVLALYLWFCCSYFWTIEPLATLEKMRGYFQEMMIVWLVWEFAETPRDLRALLARLRCRLMGAGGC